VTHIQLPGVAAMTSYDTLFNRERYEHWKLLNQHGWKPFLSNDRSEHSGLKVICAL
jgi:hypothetical protein